MTMQHQKSIADSAYADAITNTETARPGADWFKTERSAAHAQIIEDGLPHRRMEAWRWTDLR